MRSRTQLTVLTAAAIGLGSLATGCSIGYSSMLFVTKTNAALDLDTKPPTAEISIGRRELIIAPTYEAGKTPPAMGSFRFDTNLFSTYLGSTFAVGDAAVAMAVLYGDDDWWPPEQPKGVYNQDYWEALEGETDVNGKVVNTGAFSSGLELTQLPRFPKWLPKHIRNQTSRDVRPLVFGTDTMFGVKIAWSGTGGTMPDSIKLGYNRKELAWAPITLRLKDPENAGTTPEQIANAAHIAQAPSLLATVDAGVEVATLDDTKITYLQYIATGRAATALATRRGVRTAMLTRLDPKAAKITKQQEVEAKNDDATVASQDVLLEWMDSPELLEVQDLADAAAALEQQASASPNDTALQQAANNARVRSDLAQRLVDREPGTQITQGQLNGEMLLEWLRTQGKASGPGDEVLWTFGSTKNDLDGAIDHFGIR